MSRSDPLIEMLDQEEWYLDSGGRRLELSAMTAEERVQAAERLYRLALVFARSYFRDLYAYGSPSGEQAQIDLDRAEAEAESITDSAENARRWMVQMPLYEALRGRKAPVVPEDLEEPPPPPRMANEQNRVELVALDAAIRRTEENLQYLRELRGRLA